MIITRILMIFIVLMLGGCFSEEKPLKVAISPWIGYEPIYQAEEFGWLDKNIELVKGKIPSDSLKRIISGKVDAAAMTMEDVILARTQGVDLRIVAVLDISSGADIVLSKEPVKSLSELRGKRVGCENSALAFLILDKTLQKAGLQHTDITIIDVPPTQQLDAWKRNTVDVVITYEPYATQLLTLDANYVISSRELPEMIYDVLAVRADRVIGRESSIDKLLQSHFRSLEYFHKNYQDTLFRIAAREGNSPADVKRALGGIVLPSKVANKVFFEETSSLYKTAIELNTLMFEKGFIVKKSSLHNLTDSTYIEEM